MNQRCQLEQDRIRETVSAVLSLHFQNVCFHVGMIQTGSQHTFHALAVKQSKRNCRCNQYQRCKQYLSYIVLIVFTFRLLFCLLSHSLTIHSCSTTFSSLPFLFATILSEFIQRPGSSLLTTKYGLSKSNSYILFQFRIISHYLFHCVDHILHIVIRQTIVQRNTHDLVVIFLRVWT